MQTWYFRHIFSNKFIHIKIKLNVLNPGPTVSNFWIWTFTILDVLWVYYKKAYKMSFSRLRGQINIKITDLYPAKRCRSGAAALYISVWGKTIRDITYLSHSSLRYWPEDLISLTHSACVMLNTALPFTCHRHNVYSFLIVWLIWRLYLSIDVNLFAVYVDTLRFFKD